MNDDLPKERPKHRQKLMDLVKEGKHKQDQGPAPRKRKKPFELPVWLRDIEKSRCEYCGMVHLGMECLSKPKPKQPKRGKSE